MAQAAQVRCPREEALRHPRSAINYAICQLGRLAGVSPEILRHWRIEFEEAGFTTIFVAPGTNKRIRFRRIDPEVWEEINSGIFRMSVAKWPRVIGGVAQSSSDLVVPFSSSTKPEVGPLFAVAGEDLVDCPVDLPLATLLMLSRFEETIPHSRDEHDRFSAFSSVAWRGGFLRRPIVDEWGLAMEGALRHLLPGWRPTVRRFRVKLGHDADVIGIPMIFRTTLAHTLRRGRPDATIRDLISPWTRSATAYQRMLLQLVQLSGDYRLDSAVYWKFSASGPHDTGYDPRVPRIQAMISKFRSNGIEMGIHPSYRSFRDPDRFRTEVTALQELLGSQRLGGRQDYLRWCPETWIEWDSMGLAYDASVGFADHIGFRAGTCHPYRPWLLSLGRQANLLEIPLLAMDSTLECYMKLNPDQAFRGLFECVERCRAVGGVFSLVWHNTTLMRAGYSAIYRKFLQEIAGSDAYDWRKSSDEIC
jgi:hypothetical protein